MSEYTLSHLLGVNEMTLSAMRSGRAGEYQMLGNSGKIDASNFSDQLEELMAKMELKSDSGSQIVSRPSLTGLFMDSRIGSIGSGSVTANREADDSTEEDSYSTEETDTQQGTADDVLGAVSASDAAATSRTNNTSSLSAREIVYATGNANGDLVQKINASTTIEERLGYVNQLRDKIVTALKDAGHTAYDIGKTDKISIDGTIYDVVKASKGLGKESAVQFLEVKATTGASSSRQAIFDAGVNEQNTLPDISRSTDPSERRLMAAQFRDKVVENLNSNGYEATAGSSPDKIVVDGVTYDILRNVNSPGAMVYFQSIPV
jgi:hypothetical protein